MEVITKEKILEFQTNLTDKVRKELVQNNVKYCYDHFINYMVNYNIKDKKIKKIISKEYFEQKSRYFTFDRIVIMNEVQKKLEDLFPDCHIMYQLNDSDGAEVFITWD